MKAVVLTLSGVLFLSQCSLSQNPLDEFPAPVQNPKPPSTKPDPVEAVASDALRLSAPDVFSFVELQEGRFDMSNRVLIPEYQGRIDILNLGDFNGAEFDSSSGVFRWTPSKGIVKEGLMTEQELKVRLIAEAPGQVPLVLSRSIKILIHRSAGQPIVESVNFRANSLREGGSYDFDIVVKDPDAGLTPESAPHVTILNPAVGHPKIRSLSSYVTRLNSRLTVDGKSWIYNFRLNLNGEELTNSSVLAGFDIEVRGQFGGLSDTVSFRRHVFTKLGSLVSNNSPTALLARVGQPFQYVFSVWDPRGEARLELLKEPIYPEGAKFVCSSSTTTVFRCELSWVPTEAQVGVVSTLSYSVKGFNQDPADADFVEGRFEQVIRVLDAETPAYFLPEVEDSEDLDSSSGLENPAPIVSPEVIPNTQADEASDLKGAK